MDSDGVARRSSNNSMRGGFLGQGSALSGCYIYSPAPPLSQTCRGDRDNDNLQGETRLEAIFTFDPQAVLALCLVGVAVAAPQLRLGGLRSVSSVSSVTNQDEVTTVLMINY